MNVNYSTFAMQGSVIKFENDELRNRNKTDTERKLMLVNCAVNIPLALTSIIGNALVLHAIKKTPSLRSPSIMLLCGLALTDLAVSSIVQPLFIANTVIQLYDQSQRLIQLFRSGYSTVGFSLCGVSLCTVTAISLDRLLAIQKPLRYPIIVTTSRITRILIPTWAICLLCSSAQLWEHRVLLVSVIVIIGLCLCISTACHVRIYRILRRHQIEIQIQMQVVERGTTNINNMASLRKSAFNAFIVFIVLVICYCPYLVVYIAFSIGVKGNENLYKSLASTAVFINSALNPFLYCWRLREIRRSVLKTYCELFSCK